MILPALQLFGDKGSASLQRIYSHRAALTAMEWAEQVRRMDDGRRYRFSYAPYQREMMATPYRQDVQLTVFMLGSRLGKTEVSMNIVGHAIDEEPRRILALYPTISQAEKWSKETFEKELCENTEPLKYLVRGGRRNSSNTILHKIFPGGLINIFGGNAPGEMRRAKGNLLFADEVDALQEQSGDEGDQLEIFWYRASEYPDAIKIAASYPSETGKSRIVRLMEGSDYRKYFTPCAKCGEPFIMLREHIRHPDGKPEKAEIEAPCCGRMVSDQQRRGMVHDPGAEWRATRDFHGVAGFWGNGMLSPHPVQKGFESHLHWVAQQQINAEKADNPDRARKVLANTFDALPYTPERLEAPEADTLYARREDYSARTELPDGVLLITAGVDVQKEWLEVSVWGWGDNQESWQLEHEKIAGSYDDPKTWRKLDTYLAKAVFPHPIGVDIGVKIAMVDAGKWGSVVCDWTRKKANRRIYASQGSPTINAPVIKEARVERIKGSQKKVKIYPLGVNQIKDVIYHRLAIEPAGGGEDAPTGLVHFGEHLPVSYFDGLTCEYGQEERFRGETYTRYINPPGRRNEPLDTYVYAYAASKLYNKPMGRLRAELERQAERGEGNKEERQKPNRFIKPGGKKWRI